MRRAPPYPTVTLAGGPADGLVAALHPLDPGAPYRAAWDALGREAFAANPFYEADYALAAAPAFGRGVQLLLVADRPPEEPGARLLALWPFRPSRTRWGLPLGVLVGWAHGYSALGVPLLARDAPERALSGLLAAPRALGLPPRLLMSTLPQEGPFAELLAGCAARAGLRRAAYWPYARAFLDLQGLAPSERAAYLEHMPGKRRRKLRQLLKRLEAEAPLGLETARAPAALAEALEDYIALEGAGWKGRAGTAITGRPAEIAFMRALVAALGAEGRIRIDRLRRGPRTLAAAILPITGGEAGRTAWWLKIAHDEAEARNSPGVQLVHRLTRAVLDDPDLAQVDSCAAGDYRLAEMFWTGRRSLAHVLIEGGGPGAGPAGNGGDRLFPLAAALERARERVARIRAARRAAEP
ncbi:GNAT family N-acetyltransferase [Methylobacterium planeticum]|uniref:GNAT family N-acetyltransferase n=1 Tax=Methylobacterium planeticum TaxID=2615211 RepID=A0A6N6MJ34_9HYPH|nr:GNAT family N-acetyltransferase [Methylobacterium planeticum]KAB1070467.1 GNAT family N-acetyltransferase [Methylobacterium planeticum]